MTVFFHDAWELQADGTYVQRHPQPDEPEPSAAARKSRPIKWDNIKSFS